MQSVSTNTTVVDLMRKSRPVLLTTIVVSFTCGIGVVSHAQTARPAITTYGERNANAPKELDIFSFLIGKWEGTGTTKLADGTTAEFTLTWIGRYVLDGMAIADEGHSTFPDGRPALGISLRQYDESKKAWIVEFLNVSNSFLRRQVNADSGSVTIDGNAVVIVSEAPDMWGRETYRVESPDLFTYSIDFSNDGGRTWGEPQIEMRLSRKE
jgi:hypothetical protein